MSTPYSPPVGQAPSPDYNQPLKSNGFGTAALVLGIVAIVFSIIPVVGFIAFILGPLALIFGVIGVTRKFTKKGTSITGAILGALSIIIAIIVTVVIAAAANSVSETLNKEHKIEYVVTSTGKANVTYWNGDGSSNEEITADWKKEVTATGLGLSTLTVTGDFAAATSVTCEILVDGVSTSKNSGSGTGAMASCSGSSTK
ncbi:putative PurR-regulated permease PerM [Pseudarthrobacter siccitolerans]|uniref:PurR-regulated permease PerM n=1 Tax=Pseudarthrobacter siccitolerans TaxID=861266 RepID=A0ABU0PQ34_9MICC|nr:hypothetical protein [Pseudarthrobacter siccitolerans]MDQ0676070.1 putative PurR-regulated permease PerM [Pseudarthrobacter siccitolerans]